MVEILCLISSALLFTRSAGSCFLTWTSLTSFFFFLLSEMIDYFLPPTAFFYAPLPLISRASKIVSVSPFINGVCQIVVDPPFYTDLFPPGSLFGTSQIL